MGLGITSIDFVPGLQPRLGPGLLSEPAQKRARQPYLPRFMAGGATNPLGARALYLGDTLYRIHGTNQPSTIGSFVSSGCIRLTNEDITDLYGRVKVGTRVARGKVSRSLGQT
jgi:L,D-transpeptidase-like protein